MNDKVYISILVTKETSDVLNREANLRNMGFGECAGNIMDTLISEKTPNTLI